MNAQLKPSAVFARESVASVRDDIELLLHEHYAEVSHHPDIPPGCDYAKYEQAEKVGVLRIYTMRVGGMLAGYEIFTIAFSLHYKSSLQARMDTLFVHPGYRKGLDGYRFLKWVDREIEKEGVQICYQHDKILPDGRLDLGPLFERMGYAEIYRVYWKRYDAPSSAP